MASRFDPHFALPTYSGNRAAGSLCSTRRSCSRRSPRPPFASAHDLRNEVLIVFHGAELPAPTQHQSLVDCGHQMVMRALDISVLVGFTHCDQPGSHPIVSQQGEIPRVILPARPTAPKPVRRRRTVVALTDQRNSSKLESVKKSGSAINVN